MINLRLNISYLEQLFGFKAGTAEQYAGKSIKEIMEAEAAAGNSQAANFTQTVFSNIDDIIKIFNLSDRNNCSLILSQLAYFELLELLPLLDDKVMFNALKFLSKDTIIKVMFKMDKKSLAKLTFANIPLEKFIKKTKENEFNTFFESTNIKKQDIINSVKGLEHYQLCSMMETLTGVPVNSTSPEAVQNKLMTLGNADFKKAIRAFSPEVKGTMIINMITEKPELAQEFSKTALISPLTELQGEDFYDAFSVLDTKNLLLMMQELPEEVLPLVVAEMKTDDLAVILMKNPELLSNIAFD